jgi:hypothetical protein
LRKNAWNNISRFENKLDVVSGKDFLLPLLKNYITIKATERFRKDEKHQFANRLALGVRLSKFETLKTHMQEIMALQE